MNAPRWADAAVFICIAISLAACAVIAVVLLRGGM